MFGFRRSSKGSYSANASESVENNNSVRVECADESGADQLTGTTQISGLSSAFPSTTVGESAEDLEDIVGCTSTFQSYCSEWEKLFTRPDYLKCIKTFSMRGGLRSSRFRSIAWKLFLGVLPEDQMLWSSASNQWRQQYTDLKNRLIINPRNAEAKDLSINNPLSQEVESPWNQFFLDNELRLTIKQDVIRTYPDVPFFAEDRIHNIMLDVLFCYGRKYSVIEYRQGMHELLAPLIFVLHCDHQAFLHACEIESVGQFQQFQRDLAKELLNPEFLEHDAYSLFCQIMQTAESWYVSKETIPPPIKVNSAVLAQPFTRSQDVHPSNVIVAKLMHIQDDLLRSIDEDLYEHLIKMDIAPQIYGIRWLRLLFGREFPMQDLLILWDAIFADDVAFSLVDYVFVAMLVYLKNALLSSDYPSCLRLLMKYPPIPDIQYFVDKAIKIRDPDKFPNLNTLYYKSSVESGTNDGHSSVLESAARSISGKGGSLAQSLSSLTRIGMKRPETLGLGHPSNANMSKSTSEPMNLITDTAASPDLVIDRRKGSTASLSLIEGSLLDAKYTGSLRQNPSSQSLARLEREVMSSSVVEQMSTASSEGNASPKAGAGRFSFFANRGTRKSFVKAKPTTKNTEQDSTVTPIYTGNVDSTCRRCAAELDFHIGTIQKFILRQNSFDDNDEILLALAGIKQVRDVLKGVLKPSDMYSNPETSHSAQCGNYYYRKQQAGSAQSSLAATPLYEVPSGKFFVATPDLLSSDTDINSPDNGGHLPEASVMERNAGSDTVVPWETSRSNCDSEVPSNKSRHSVEELPKAEVVARLHRRGSRKANVPLECKFQKQMPEYVSLLNSEVEMVELQKETAKLSHEMMSKLNEQRLACKDLIFSKTGERDHVLARATDVHAHPGGLFNQTAKLGEGDVPLHAQPQDFNDVLQINKLSDKLNHMHVQK